MARIFHSVREVVEGLGGVSVVARELGVVETAVWNWISAGVIPSNKYVAMHEMLADAEASAPNTLWSMTTRASRQPEIAA
jgi:transposase-like protein